MYAFLATVLFSLASFYVGKAQGVQEGLKESKQIEQEVNAWLRSLSESDS